MKFSSVILRSKWFFSGLLVFAVAGLSMLLLLGKAASFIALNEYHAHPLNIFFYLYTFIGDGIFALALITLFFFILKRKQEGMALLLSYLLSGLVAQILKHSVTAPRPRMFFAPGQYLHFIEGVSHTGFSSFPSGHTATAFALATVLAMNTKSGAWQLLILLGALLVAYSRIYLGQHFLTDVLTGAMVGVITGMLSFFLASKMKKIKFSTGKKGDEKSVNPSQ